MANSDIRRGLVPVRHLNGNPFNGKFNVYYLAVSEGTATFIGDPVNAAGGADALGKYATVDQAAANETILGVVIGFGDTPNLMVDTTNLARTYRPSSTAMYCAVVDDPDVIFEIQEDDGTMDATDVMSGCDIVFTHAGDTTSGISGCELNSSDGGTTSGMQCRVLGLVDREDNVLGANAKWEVLIVEHEMRNATLKA